MAASWTRSRDHQRRHRLSKKSSSENGSASASLPAPLARERGPGAALLPPHCANTRRSGETISACHANRWFAVRRIESLLQYLWDSVRNYFFELFCAAASTSCRSASSSGALPSKPCDIVFRQIGGLSIPSRPS